MLAFAHWRSCKRRLPLPLPAVPVATSSHARQHNKTDLEYWHLLHKRHLPASLLVFCHFAMKILLHRILQSVQSGHFLNVGWQGAIHASLVSPVPAFSLTGCVVVECVSTLLLDALDL